MQIFLDYIIKNIHFLNKELIQNFFDNEINCTRISKLFEKYKPVSYYYIDFLFKKIFPDLYKHQTNSKEEENRLNQKIINFKLKVNENVEFFEKMIEYVKSYFGKIKNAGLQQQEEKILDHLFFMFPNEKLLLNSKKQMVQ